MHAVTHVIGQLFLVPSRARDTNHRYRKMSAPHEVVQSRIDLLETQVSGGTEDHQGIGIAALHITPSFRGGHRSRAAWPTTACRHTRHDHVTRSENTELRSTRWPARQSRSPPAPSNVPRRNRKRDRRTPPASGSSPGPPRSDPTGARK